MTLIIWNNGISKIKMIKQYHIVQSGQTDSNIYLFIPSTWATPSTPSTYQYNTMAPSTVWKE